MDVATSNFNPLATDDLYASWMWPLLPILTVTRELSMESIHSAMQSKCPPDHPASFGMKPEGLGTRLHAELVKLVKS